MPKRRGRRGRRYRRKSERTEKLSNEKQPRQDAIDRFERILDIQVATLESIDDKSARLISFVGVLLGVVATVSRVVPRMKSSTVQFIDDGSIAGAIALTVGVVGLLVSLVYATVAYLSTEFDYGLDADIADALAREENVRNQTYRTIVLRGYADSLRENKPIIDRNARRFRYALAALVGALFALMFSVGYYLVSLPDFIELVTSSLGTIVVGSLYIYIRDEAYLTTSSESNAKE